MAHRNTIIRIVYGSELYGTNIGASGDRDEMGVCVEDPEYIYGLNGFEQHIHRDAWVRAGKAANAKSLPGELDLKIYGLKKFLRLLLKGDPSLEMLLYAPPDKTIITTPVGAELQALAPAFASRSTGRKFLGYLVDQRERLMGLRGQKDVNRPDLVERYGFDTKFAGHVIRLGLQGIEFLETGRITLPMAERERQLVVDVRTGKYTLAQVNTLSFEMQDQLENLTTTSPLPQHSDGAAVDRFLMSVYPRYWQSRNCLAAA